MNQDSLKTGKFAKCRMLFWGFFKIAALVVGGGYAIVPAAEAEFIRKRHLLDETELLDMMAIIQSMPGIIAGNAALYIGYRCAGIAGALSALLGVATPSTLMILLIAIFLHNTNLNVPAIQGAFTGAQAAITSSLFSWQLQRQQQLLYLKFRRFGSFLPEPSWESSVNLSFHPGNPPERQHRRESKNHEYVFFVSAFC